MTQYELAVHLSVYRSSSKLKRAVKSNGLVHPDRKKALRAARLIASACPDEVQWVNVSRAQYTSVARVKL